MQAEHKPREKDKFSLEFVMEQLEVLIQTYILEKEVLMEPFCAILDQFCLVFSALNSFLGIAFSDVQEKVKIIRANNQTFPGLRGFLSFIRLQMQQGVHLLNGDNNSSLCAPKQFKKYTSTSRNLVRMMWLLTFIRTTFQLSSDPLLPVPDILCSAYDAAFGERHNWLIRKGAKFAIKTSGNRHELIKAFMGEHCTEEIFPELNRKFLERLVPIHEALWGFYRDHKLTDLQ